PSTSAAAYPPDRHLAAASPPDGTPYADPDLADRSEKVVVMGFAPATRAGHHPGDAAPVVDETGMTGLRRVGDDGAAPVVVVQDRLGHLTALCERQLIGL